MKMTEVEPRISYMQHQLDYLRRTRHDQTEQARLQATMAALDAIALSCFQ